MTARKGDWMQTASGKQFWPIDPRPEDVDINDIAHALSQVCRYGGHCRTFYSVAEHSVYVARACPPELRLAGLLHDASEAYISDIVRPAKRFIEGYIAIEDRLQAAIGEAFDVSLAEFHAIKEWDNAVLLDEQAQIMLPPPEPWTPLGVEPAGFTIACHSPAVAKAGFLNMFHKLTAAR